MAKTSRDARKHIRAISELFSGVNAVGCAVVEDILRRSAKRKYLKQSLRRLIMNGFIKDDGKSFSPTIKGFLLFRRFSGKKKILSAKPEHWDGKWRLVTFDVPVRFDKERDQIRSLLKEFDFYQLQKSVWVCPSSVSENFWRMLVKEDLDKHCKTMVVNVIEGDDELREHFRIS